MSHPISQSRLFHLNERILELTQGDITRIPAEAIVNAANEKLAGGGGVDGAIHRAGGPTLMKELDEIRRQIGRCATGSAVVTSAGALPARFVFHAVGPVYRNGEQGAAALLASCYRTCLALAGEHGLESISFPSISTGVYGYPIEEAASIALCEVTKHLQHPGPIRRVVLVQFSAADHQVYMRKAQLFWRQTSGEGAAAV
jgi:O-acetyl-ADP-ribose deacetylase (regulator of RNase III)